MCSMVKVTQWRSLSLTPSPNHRLNQSPIRYPDQNQNPLDSRMNLRLSQGSRPPNLNPNLSLKWSLSPSLRLSLRPSLKKTMTFSLETHLNSVQKIPVIIKWNSPTIFVTP